MTLILVTTAHPQSLQFQGPGFGRLVQPRHYSSIAATAHSGIPWAADNDCFQRLDPVAYQKMLDAIYGLPGCLFVVAPDVVGDWEDTRDNFDDWHSTLSAIGQPIAYAAQDGQPPRWVPWEKIGAIFIGGTNEYKLSAEAERLGREAKLRGKWLHMGRVNGRKRFDYARATGCDSVDGSSFARWRDTWLPLALTWHRDHLQTRLPLEDAP